MTYLTCTILALLIIVWQMPKRLKTHEYVFVILFGFCFQQTVDVYIDLKYDLYGYFDVGVDWGYIPVIFLLFPALGCIFMNWFPYGQSIYRKATYIFYWTVISTMYESGAVQSSYFYYHGWKLWWSFFLYPILFSIKGIALYLYRRIYEKEEGGT